MKLKHQKLFQPFRIGRMEIKNRIAMCPMLTAGYFDEYGVINDSAIDLYEERAKGGVGLVFTFGVIPNSGLEKNMMAVSPFADPARFLSQMRKLADRLHHYGTKLFVQLWYGVGRALPPAALLEGEPIAPSVCSNRWDPNVKCWEMTKEEIQRLIQATAEAAVMCKQAGCDGVDVNGAYGGYLGDQFTFDAYNRRTDEYGGDIDGKIKLQLDTVKAIKDACGQDFPVTIRFGVKHYAKAEFQGAIEGEQYKEFGRDVKQSLEMAKKLEEAGYDAFLVGNGCFDSMYWQYPPMYQKDGLWLKDSEQLKAAVHIPVICPGKITTPELEEKALENDMADAIGLGRALLADPAWANKARMGLDEEIRPCISCNNGCVGRANEGLDIRCAVNANLSSSRLEPASKKKKIGVIGGGIAGMEAARVAALRGHEVTIYEKGDCLGGVLIAAAIPDYKEADRRLLQWYERYLNKLGVKILYHTEMTLEAIQEEDIDEIIVCTGTTEKIPPIPGIELENVTTAIDVLLGKKKTGQKVSVIGGGQVGCEIALWLKEQGKEVTIIEAQSGLLDAGAIPTVNKLMLLDLLTYHGITTYVDAKVTAIHGNSVDVHMPEGDQNIKTDTVVLAVGYHADDRLYKEIARNIPKKVWLAGDAKQPGNVMTAVSDGYALGNCI